MGKEMGEHLLGGSIYMPGIHRLSARKVESLKRPGRHCDGGGLYLSVAKGGSKSWCYMWVIKGRRREMGLGGYPGVTLSNARGRAQVAREMVANGKNPILERRKEVVLTFGEAADHLVENLKQDWSSEKHREQWKRTVTHYCEPIREIPVRQITTDDVLRVLKPIWSTKDETARRLRSRIERILDYASAHNWREGDNPARWNGHLRDILPKQDKSKRKNFASMPYEELAGFLKTLRSTNTLGSMALEFTILTAARTNETLGARWSEFDLEDRLWSIPAERMKGNQVHDVPLCNRAIEILNAARPYKNSDFVFPGAKKGKPLSNMSMSMALRRITEKKCTVHGFRSSFRDWCGDKTSFPREVAEAALAHKVGNKVEQAYRRRNALEKRRELMTEWGRYVTAP